MMDDSKGEVAPFEKRPVRIVTSVPGTAQLGKERKYRTQIGEKGEESARKGLITFECTYSQLFSIIPNQFRYSAEYICHPSICSGGRALKCLG